MYLALQTKYVYSLRIVVVVVDIVVVHRFVWCTVDTNSRRSKCICVISSTGAIHNCIILVI